MSVGSDSSASLQRRVPDPSEAEKYGLAQVKRRMAYMGMWDLKDCDPILAHDAYVFYLRSILSTAFAML